MFEEEFNKLTERQQFLMLNWLKHYLQPCKEINYNRPALELKNCFSCLFFYVTREQFTCAMSKLGFSVVKNEKLDYVFNVSEKSKMFVDFHIEQKPENTMPNIPYM